MLYDGMGALIQRDFGLYPGPPSGAVLVSFHVARAIERPACKHCGSRTILARVLPNDASFETHLFQCPNCHHVFIKRVSMDHKLLPGLAVPATSRRQSKAASVGGLFHVSLDDGPRGA
jgi:predicted RNA-binding Zn-ribbon protein involved in translation (DUF1610 family)